MFFKQKKPFSTLKSIVIVRRLFLICLKITLSMLFIFFISIISFIIILSIKPRIISSLNQEVLTQLNNIPNIYVNFDTSNATITFNSNLELEYTLKNLTINSEYFNVSIPSIVINIDFTKILFSKLVLNNVFLNNSSFNVNLDTKNKEKTESINHIFFLENMINKISSNSFSMNNFVLKNFDIIFLKNDKKFIVNILSSNINFNLSGKNMILNQKTTFQIGNDINVKLETKCENEKKRKFCSTSLKNLNLNNFKKFFDEKSILYNYSNNIKGYFDIIFNMYLNKNLHFDYGSAKITSALGNFDLREFFDEKIYFSNLIMHFSFKDNFNIINIDSLNTNFDETKFFMSMNVAKNEEGKNIDLKFNAKNLPLLKLKALWPNFLGEEDSRPWVISHIIGGTSPEANAIINIKHFKDSSKKSGVQKVYSEVHINKAILKYSDYFPVIKNIDGLAVFTEKDMKINITNGDVLKSDIERASLYMNFTKKIKNILIMLNIKGPFSDLFVHIDKNNAKNIRNNVNFFIQDNYTISNIKLDLPISNLNFNTSDINATSNIFNQSNSVVRNNSNVYLTFSKLKNSNDFSGNINLSKNKIEYLPLNLFKNIKQTLYLNYHASIEDNIIKINHIKPTSDFIDFSSSGVIDLNDNKQEIFINNIKYNNSDYNIKYSFNMLNEIPSTKILLSGNKINYNGFLDNILNFNISNNNKINIGDVSIIVNLNYFNFANNKKIYNPKFSMQLINENINILNLTGNLEKNKYFNIGLNKKNIALTSNDFGLLFSTIGLTDNLYGGDGEINLFNKINKKGETILNGNIKFSKKVAILPEQKIKDRILTDVADEKNFRELQKKLKKDAPIVFEKLRGDFTYQNDILTLNEIVANSSYIDLQILAFGFINIKTEEISLYGLLTPVGILNGLFGINRLPIISDIIFGQKNAGIFASKFTVKKANKKSNVAVNIDKFSMILPGFLRNVFNKENFTK